MKGVTRYHVTCHANFTSELSRQTQPIAEGHHMRPTTSFECSLQPKMRRIASRLLRACAPADQPLAQVFPDASAVQCVAGAGALFPPRACGKAMTAAVTLPSASASYTPQRSMKRVVWGLVCIAYGVLNLIMFAKFTPVYEATQCATEGAELKRLRLDSDIISVALQINVFCVNPNNYDVQVMTGHPGGPLGNRSQSSFVLPIFAPAVSHGFIGSNSMRSSVLHRVRQPEGARGQEPRLATRRPQEVDRDVFGRSPAR